MPGTLREVFMWVSEGLLHTPYRWAGNDPLDGVDCSGFVIEGLKATGYVPRDFDATADALLQVTFRNVEKVTQERDLRRGMLVFWGQPAHHVEVVWNTFADRTLTIGASGGSSKTRTRADAIGQDAYVKIRRLAPSWRCAVDPWGSPF